MTRLFTLLCVISTSALQLSAAEPLRIETTLVDGEAESGGTFQSHNQKVVQNRRGIFMTHIRKYHAAEITHDWRLSWSRDGGKTFATIFEATDATNPPVLEKDAADNIYLMRPDWTATNLDVRLYRFLSAEDYREPHRTVLPKGSSGKYSMIIDEPRGQLCYYSHNGIFHRVKLDGTLLDTRILTKRGTMAVPEYSSMQLDTNGVLHAAWTTLNVPIRRYWGIHHAQSADGGTTWTTFAGAPLALPIVADESGPTDRLTLDDEFEPSTWLSSMLIKDGKAHFLYRTDMKPPRQHHVRVDIATGQREIDHQDVALKGETLGLAGLDGFFTTDPRSVGTPLYCISRDGRGGRIACLISRDNGATWHDYAVSDRLTDADSEEFKQGSPYATGGCRAVTPDGWIIGSFTEVGSARDPAATGYGARAGRVHFFRIAAERVNAKP